MNQAEQFCHDNESLLGAGDYAGLEERVAVVAPEIAYNVFKFEDGSVLQISRPQPFATAMSPSQFASL